MTKSKVDKFNFNGRYVFLTYKTFLTPTQIESVLPSDECNFKVSFEQGSKGVPYEHTHILVAFSKKKHIRKCTHWDITVDVKEYKNKKGETLNYLHPNIKKVISKEDWENKVKYLDKEGDVQANTLTGNEYEWLGSVREIIQSKRSWREVINDDSIGHTVMRYLNWAKEAFAARPRQNCILKELRPWQQEVRTRLHKYRDEKNDRKVIWIYDPEGGQGKTKLFKHLISEGAMGIAGGRAKDNAYKFNYEDIVAFNLVRSQEEFTPYKQIEMFKDGYIESSKYASESKIWDTSQVVVFANYYPRKAELTANRWDIAELKKGKLFWENKKVVPEVLNIKGTSLSRNQRRRRRKKLKKKIVVPSESDTESDSHLRLKSGVENLAKPRLQELQDLIASSTITTNERNSAKRLTPHGARAVLVDQL